MSLKAETIYSIAIHLPEKELEKLYCMIDKRIHSVTLTKPKKQKLITDKEAIDYLIKNVFSKVV